MSDLYEMLAVARDSIERVMIAGADGKLDNDEELRIHALKVCHRSSKLEESVPAHLRVKGPRTVAPPAPAEAEQFRMHDEPIPLTRVYEQYCWEHGDSESRPGQKGGVWLKSHCPECAPTEAGEGHKSVILNPDWECHVEAEHGPNCECEKCQSMWPVDQIR